MLLARGAIERSVLVALSSSNVNGGGDSGGDNGHRVTKNGDKDKARSIVAANSFLAGWNCGDRALVCSVWR